LIEAFGNRVDAATSAMLASSPDADFADLAIVNATLLTTIFGTVRTVFERNLPTSLGSDLHRQLTLMCLSYLNAAKTPTEVCAVCGRAG
jgi:hypothetical protein